MAAPDKNTEELIGIETHCVQPTRALFFLQTLSRVWSPTRRPPRVWFSPCRLFFCLCVCVFFFNRFNYPFFTSLFLSSNRVS
jgi:hypothetical protein